MPLQTVTALLASVSGILLFDSSNVLLPRLALPQYRNSADLKAAKASANQGERMSGGFFIRLPCQACGKIQTALWITGLCAQRDVPTRYAGAKDDADCSSDLVAA